MSRCVLITGATGVIGSELAPLFLDDGFRVKLLIRARSPEHLHERVAELVRYWGRPLDDAAIAERLEPLAGDVCQPRLGLDDATYARLAGELTHIVHAAGNVKLNQSIEEARRNALDPARHVAELAWACQRRARRGAPSRACGDPGAAVAGEDRSAPFPGQAPQGPFVKLDAVTTVGVAGRMAGLVPERRLTEPREFHNHYERAKAEAEEYLFGQLAAGLPLSIHRPSMVVGRSDTGRVIRRQVFYYLCEFFTGGKTWGFLPEFGDARLDIVPVDYVARAIHLAATHPDTAGRVLHLCSGPERSIGLGELADLVRRQAQERGEKLPRLRYAPVRWFRRVLAVLAVVTWGRARRRLAALPHFLAYLDERQEFATAATEGWLAPQGLTAPRPQGYLGVLGGAQKKPLTANRRA